ncbi:MAG TPA: recombinase family protein [Candidatus Acidoferrales bacterium]|nr:recombinase family protein [Candidatus Acidoferrales bacterium]
MTPALRCAAYARYSTDRQNPLSTEDQLEKCRQYAAERGWTFLERHVYTDEEISGATLDRPGLRLLLEAVELKPRPFDALLLEDASRLSRKQADVLNLCERLSFAGVSIHFISQGIDSGDEKFQLLLLARGMIDQLFLADTAKRVRRGLEGLIRRGLHTGGRCHGYRSRKDSDGTRLEIYEPEAIIVRRIFHLYADGLSLKAIAKKLNAEGVTSPQPQQGRISRSWCPTSIRNILRNERYLGKIVWSRKHKVRDPKTGRRVFRKKEGETPIRGADQPELQIVTDALWCAVEDRRELVKRIYEDAGKRPGLLRSKAMNVPYLFSGLLKCSQCGANLQIVAGRGRNHPNQTYGCPLNFHRGDSVCSNRVRVRRDVLERELLAGLQEKVLRKEAVEYALDRFEEQLLKEVDNIGGDMDRLRKRKAELESETARLAAGLASGLYSVTVMSEIARREREIAEIGERLLSSGPDSVRSRIKKLRETALRRISDVRETLNGDPVTARAYLARHVEKIEMRPDGRAYVASGSWNLLGERRWDGAEGQS